jgi:hypothetical protein
MPALGWSLAGTVEGDNGSVILFYSKDGLTAGIAIVSQADGTTLVILTKPS